MPTCIHCQNETIGLFCHHCGQRSIVKRLSVVNLGHDFLSRVYGLDGMLPRTLRDLTIRPGQASLKYIQGDRVTYYGPVGYLFTMITIYLILGSLLGVDLAKFQLESAKTVAQYSAEEASIALSLNKWVADNFRLVSLFIALGTFPFLWLLFRSSKLNLIESSVLIFYTSGHVYWFSFVSLLLYAISGYIVSVNASLIIWLGYFLFALTDLYRYQAWWKVIAKGLLVFILSNILSMILLYAGFVLFK